MRAPTCCIRSSSTVAPSVNPGSSGSLSTADAAPAPDSSFFWGGACRSVNHMVVEATETRPHQSNQEAMQARTA